MFELRKLARNMLGILHILKVLERKMNELEIDELDSLPVKIERGELTK